MHVELSIVATTHLSENTTPLSMHCTQEVIDPTETQTFAKEPKFAKLLRKLNKAPARCQ